jgi:hypothetical protein
MVKQKSTYLKINSVQSLHNYLQCSFKKKRWPWLTNHIPDVIWFLGKRFFIKEGYGGWAIVGIVSRLEVNIIKIIWKYI